MKFPSKLWGRRFGTGPLPPKIELRVIFPCLMPGAVLVQIEHHGMEIIDNIDILTHKLATM
jgi:hypothetical protein